MIDENYVQLNGSEEIQTVLLYIFRQFHDLCEKYGLIYNAFGGTMLGAVRHNGFIPWDDDIDVTMPREDYERLIKILRNDNDSELLVQCFPDENYIYPFAKVGLKETVLVENVVKNPYDKLTLSIDVFPVDGYPDNAADIDEYCSYEDNIILCAYRMSNIRLLLHPKRLLKKVKSLWKGYKYWVNKQISIAKKYGVEDHELLLCQGAGWGKKGIIEKSTYFDRKLYDFDNAKIWGIRDYDEHMRNLYGDYMKLPPEDKRTSPHDDIILISQEKYRKIIDA